jgi:nickel/cobalt transporter (NicO) family protein
MPLTLAVAFAAAGIGAFHTLAPDHWVPFAALARAERWSTKRTALVTVLCGLGHVTVSVVLGLCGVIFGLGLLQSFGRRLEGVAGFLLIAFGVAYGLWGLHRSVQAQWHHHSGTVPHWHIGHHGHAHRHGPAGAGPMTPLALFALFSADPCVAVIPLMFAAAPLGWTSTLVVVTAYEVATIATMVMLVLPARAAASAVRSIWADRYGDALAGGVIAVVGAVVVGMGW